MPGLNENQKQHLRLTFEYVDKLFGDAIEELNPKYTRGYGDLSDEVTRGMEADVRLLADIINRMLGQLGNGGREKAERG